MFSSSYTWIWDENGTEQWVEEVHFMRWQRSLVEEGLLSLTKVTQLVLRHVMAWKSHTNVGEVNHIVWLKYGVKGVEFPYTFP